MKQVKMLILVVLAVALVTFAGCTSSNPAAPAGSSQAMTQDENSGHLTGTIGEIKDFMFVVTDQEGNAYSFQFETKPEGLDNLADGDEVTVDYEGTLSQVDSFVGKTISVTKAN